MSEYNDIGPVGSAQPETGKQPENSQEIQPGTVVRVDTGLRNDPNQNTLYVFEGMVTTADGPRAKLAFKTADGKTFKRVAHFDDLILG